MEELLKIILTEIRKRPSGTKAYEDLYYMAKDSLRTDEAMGVKYLVELAEIIEKQIPVTKTDKDLHFLFGLHRRVLLAAAPYHFDSYLLYVEWNREPEKKFYPPRRKVLRQVVDALQELAEDKLDLLAVSLPPGSGKTTLAIFYLTWLAGRIPNEPMLTGSHSNAFIRGVYDECLRILDKDGDYLYGVGFSTRFYREQRNIMDDVSWRALYMNEPIEREGLVYAEDELRRYFELPSDSPDAILGICDTKDKGADYAFLPVAYVYGEDYYIDDCVCDNGLPNIVDARLVEILVRDKVKLCRFESNSAGRRVAEKVQEEVKKRGGITHITTKFTTANKETKIIVNSAWVKEHCLFKDSSLYKKKSDYGKMMDMLCSYTVAGKNKHDDVPDGMAMLAEYAQSLSGGKVEVFKRPF